MAFGKDSHVYVANNTSGDISVIAAPNPNWAIADFLFDIAALTTGLTEIKSAVTTAELPAQIKTFSDLSNLLSVSAKLLSGTLSAGSRQTEAAKAVIEQINKKGYKIKNGEFKDVFEKNFLDIYLSPSGYAGLLGAATVTLLIYSNKLVKTAHFNTDPDKSWLAESQGIWAVKYGSIWQKTGNTPENKWT
ncbi:hypothetical protein [Pseudomonas sp. 5P_3.1_Bac2]|uniref:hypothetical protein n=1 Tax=Pseudomonas sp. 5P_3.1_Bac2 TaxID=2971617 RepID=UPI0021C7706E|nr:hypothetical protein [Pseudomonas sp. 5P_3.1_Bac2]MCU1716157.1 hypothetical protein [Pseudomonas sp. 5P_3.1_Bac2]